MNTQQIQRKIVYIDGVFQRKFLLLFLLLCAFVVAGNVLFQVFYLQAALDAQMFRMTIVVDNIGDVLVQNLLEFNIVLASMAVLLTLALYSFIRARLVYFMTAMTRHLAGGRIGEPDEAEIRRLPRQFEDIDQVLGELFEQVARRHRAEEHIVVLMREFTDDPTEERRRGLLEAVHDVAG